MTAQNLAPIDEASIINVDDFRHRLACCTSIIGVLSEYCLDHSSDMTSGGNAYGSLKMVFREMDELVGLLLDVDQFVRS